MTGVSPRQLDDDPVLCELLVAPFTTCGEPVFEDSDRCAKHYIRSLESIAQSLNRDREAAESRVRAVLAVAAEFDQRGLIGRTYADRLRAALTGTTSEEGHRG